MKLTKHAKSRALFYHNAQPNAELLEFLEDGNFVKRWVPKLRGKYVKLNNGRHETRESAIMEATQFRDYCRNLLGSKP